MFDKLTIEDSTSEADKYNDLRAWQESQQCCFCGNDLDDSELHRGHCSDCD
jgi:hypothetical protein